MYINNPETKKEERKSLIDNFFGEELKSDKKKKFVSIFKEILA